MPIGYYHHLFEDETDTMSQQRASSFQCMTIKTLRPLLLILAIAAILSAHSPVFAATYASTQSSARPFGLDIVDKVQVAGSDTRSAEFQDSYLSTMQSWENMDLTSPSFTDLTSTIAIDPSKINLANSYDTRVYFVGDATGNHNALGFNTLDTGISSGDPQLIFPDASETYLTFKFFNTKIDIRTRSNPLIPGDFVSLGTMDAGTQLDFFLISDRTRKITDVYTADQSINPDGLDHAIAFALADSPYLFIAFGDTFGETGTFKSNVFAVDIGSANVQALTSMPEPSTMVILCSFLGLVLYRKHALMTVAKKPSH